MVEAPVARIQQEGRSMTIDIPEPLEKQLGLVATDAGVSVKEYVLRALIGNLVSETQRRRLNSPEQTAALLSLSELIERTDESASDAEFETWLESKGVVLQPAQSTHKESAYVQR
jgi:hypothetical protein